MWNLIFWVLFRASAANQVPTLLYPNRTENSAVSENIWAIGLKVTLGMLLLSIAMLMMSLLIVFYKLLQ